MNARITNKSFNKWNIFENFSKNTFQKIDIAYPANIETSKYLKKFKCKKIKNIGNNKPTAFVFFFILLFIVLKL